MRGCQGVIPHVGVHGGAVEERTTGVPRTDETGLGGGGGGGGEGDTLAGLFSLYTLYTVQGRGPGISPPQIYFPPQEF